MRLLALCATTLLAAAVSSACGRSQEETRYAAGFNEEVFTTIPIGVSQSEVIQRLGEPLEKWNHWNDKGIHDRVFLAYSKRESLGATHFRVLIFSPDGRLIDREADYYLR